MKAKLRETAGYVLAMSILVLNLRKIQSAFLRLVLLWLGSLVPQENWLLFSRHYLLSTMMNILHLHDKRLYAFCQNAQKEKP